LFFKEYKVLKTTSGFSGDEFIAVSMRNEAMIFMGLTAVGVLSSFLFMTLIQRNQSANRRLIICGYHPFELACSILVMMLFIVLVVSLYFVSVFPIVFKVKHLVRLMLGFPLIGFVYAWCS